MIVFRPIFQLFCAAGQYSTSFCPPLKKAKISYFFEKIFQKSMIYSDFERASLKIGDFEAKFDRGFENQ